MYNTIGQLAKDNECLQYSVSTRLTSILITTRNQMVAGQTAAGEIAVKVGVELCFVALAILSIIETIVRGILGIVIGVPLDCFTNNEWAFPVTGFGAIITAANIAVCFMALKENFTADDALNDDIIMPSGALVHDHILPSANTFVEDRVGTMKSLGFKGF